MFCVLCIPIGDTYITRDMCMGIHISRGYTYHGDTHITGIHISRGYTYHGDTHITGIHISRGYTYHGDTHITATPCPDFSEGRGQLYTGRVVIASPLFSTSTVDSTLTLSRSVCKHTHIKRPCKSGRLKKYNSKKRP